MGSSAVVIVGSVASGLCEPSSDVDLALVADQEVVRRLQVPRWAEGRPTELILDDRQLQYYGVALETVEKQLKRLVTLGRMCLELITLGLKVTALLDDVPFDPRKRPFVSGTTGLLGTELSEQFRSLLAPVGDVASLETSEDYSAFDFSGRMKAVFSTLEKAARSQGSSFG